MATEVKTTEARGNTKARAFCLTLNEIDREEELIEGLRTYKSLKYLMIGAIETAPTTGHLHKHVYVYFNVPIKLNLKKCAGCHVEIAMGSFKNNYEYLTKEGPLTYEWGEKPHQGIKTIKELRELPYDETPPQYKRIKQEVDREYKDKKVFFDMLNEIRAKKLKGPEIIYITGDPGKGKTYSAYEFACLDYENNEDIGKLTLKNDFIDITNEDAKCFVIEEFRPSQIKATDFLQLTDKYGYRCNVKGSFRTLRPEKIYIASIIPPEKIYQEEVNQQFMRRITKIIDLNEDPDALP